jgi:hypothetical protein
LRPMRGAPTKNPSAGESNEDFLSEKLATFETGNEALQRRVEEAAQRADLDALDEAEMLLLEREVQASKFKLLL